MTQRAPSGSALSFVVVPQWQGSGSSRALRLHDGAMTIAGDLPAASTVVVEVPEGAGDALGTGVARLSALQEVLARHTEALRATTGIPITIGGDCGVGLGAATASIADGDCALLWFDAHPDLNSPAASGSGAFAGMVLRTLLGEGPVSLNPERPIDGARVVLAGTRSFDPDEDAAIERLGIAVVPPPIDEDAAAAWPAEVAAAVAATGATRVHIHLDVDVHDPSEFAAKSTPVPFGVPAAAVIGAIRAVLEQQELAGAAITEFAPSSSDDVSGELATILRLIGALSLGARR